VLFSISKVTNFNLCGQCQAGRFGLSTQTIQPRRQLQQALVLLSDTAMILRIFPWKICLVLLLIVVELEASNAQPSLIRMLEGCVAVFAYFFDIKKQLDT